MNLDVCYFEGFLYIHNALDNYINLKEMLSAQKRGRSEKHLLRMNPEEYNIGYGRDF